MSKPRVLTVGHPLGGTDPDTVLQWADDAVDTTLRLLTGETA